MLIYPLPGLCSGIWDYQINSSDTPTTIDTAQTSAIIDNTNHEIKLPRQLSPDVVAFWPDGSLQYAVLTNNQVKHYSWNGSSVVEATVFSSPTVTSPLALATADPNPDVIVCKSDSMVHYSFNGTAMVNNPALGAAGMAGASSVAVIDKEYAALINNQLQHFTFNNTSISRNMSLEPSATFSNPIDTVLFSNGMDVAVMESSQVRYFKYTSGSFAESTAVTGLADAKAMAKGNGKELSIIDGTQLKTYSYNGSGWTYNSALSVTSGLTAPTAVAVRPGSNDRIIVDGTQVKYYSFTGGALVQNTVMSVSVASVMSGGAYSSSAAVVSLAKSPGTSASKVRVRAYMVLPNNTSITWSVTAGGAWVKKWRASGTAGGTVCEVSSDGGGSWNSIGTAALAQPDASTVSLWADVSSGTNVKWKADLSTTDNAQTPKIILQGGVAVRWEANAPPIAPVVLTPGSGACITTSSPNITWQYNDPDGNTQYAYQINILKQSDNALVYDSGMIYSASQSYQIPSPSQPNVPSALWSSGTYLYKIQIKVWDSFGEASAWSAMGNFCVVAFERPRISMINSPPTGQSSPDPAVPLSHLVISPGMLAGNLPKAKAGSRVTMLIDSIGPLNSYSPTFPYLTQAATTENISSISPSGNQVNRWSVDFFTNPDLSVCPIGTVVNMTNTGPSGGAGTAVLNSPPYADGVIQIQEGSINENWVVVVNGAN